MYKLTVFMNVFLDFRSIMMMMMVVDLGIGMKD